tara:strand:+ start:158 stop:2539 length:2382 start_codon:yes stop_codon:yes gene_type:complete
MKFSEAWLREWINPEISSDALQEQLTMAGLEVDSVEPVAGDFSGVLAAKVSSVKTHPSAKTLSICEVDDGTSKHEVVCGAPNAVRGMVTAYAPPGATLPNGNVIDVVTIRDVKSQGMLCGAEELGLSDQSSGILELDKDLKAGSDLRDALGLEDLSFDIDLTPNRADCLSLRGLAREVSVINNLNITEVSINAVSPTIEDIFPIEVRAKSGCPRYAGRVIRGVKLGKINSPDWLVEKLRRSGLRSIDPVVDVTNFVMLELGQPMHAFDLNQLEERITVRYAEEGETLSLLNSKEITLCSEDLLISDRSGPIGLAGVMGGQSTGVSSASTDIFLESAYFAPLSIAATARRYGLHTDASHRFERGVDYELQLDAMERATELLTEIVGGNAGPIVQEIMLDELPKSSIIQVREERINKLIGIKIDPVEVTTALERLGFKVLQQTEMATGVSWEVESPSFRFDASCEADIIEEVCRVYGYNRVPSKLPKGNLILRDVPLNTSRPEEIKQIIAGLGYKEVVTYSFVDPDLQGILDSGSEAIALVNPMSSAQSVMRTNLLPGLINVLKFNLSRQQESVRIFELGMCFSVQDSATQSLMLGGLTSGLPFPESWNSENRNLDFFDIKGDVEALCKLNGAAVKFYPVERSFLHPGQAAKVVLMENDVGYFGRLHPEIERDLSLDMPVYVFQLRSDYLLNISPRRYRELSKFPSVRRDLALVVRSDIAAGDIESLLVRTLGDKLIEVTWFDLYQGKGIDSNEKSLGLGLTFQEASATLTDEQVSLYITEVLDVLKKEFGGRLR